jgi:hypothetical protein
MINQHPVIMDWVRLHDEYENVASTKSSCHS